MMSPLIIKHSKDEAVTGFRRDFFFAYGPLYEEINAAEVTGEANRQAAGEANPGAEANQDRSHRETLTNGAWKYFVEKTRPDPELMKKIKDKQIGPEQTEMEEEEMIKGYYMSKIAEVLKKAKGAYYDGSHGTNIDEMMRESRFKFMMISHGCLFLLQMFVFLGLGVNQLKVNSDLSNDLDNLFEGHKKIGSTMSVFEERFIKSAVFPGNQIPLVVLNKLIRTSFFKKFVPNQKWEKPSSSDVLKTVLYDLILDPVLKNSRIGILPWLHSRLGGTTATEDISTFTDILHGLHSRLVGNVTLIHERPPARNDNRANNLNPQQCDDNQRTRTDGDDNKNGANKLCHEGMDFKGVSGMAIREINIKGSVFTKKVLHLPVFTFNEVTRVLYTCLKDYENHQNPREKVVNDYLRFLQDIVPYDVDVEQLQEKGVIEVDFSSVSAGEVLKYLEEVAGEAPQTCTTHHLRTVKLAISHHNLKPWYFNYFTVAQLSLTFAIFAFIYQYFLGGSQRKNH